MPDGSEVHYVTPAASAADLQLHRQDPFAHSPLIARLEESSQDLIREYRENVRLTDQRLSRLEAFKGQATLLGGIGLTILGALSFAVIERFMLHGIL